MPSRPVERVALHQARFAMLTLGDVSRTIRMTKAATRPSVRPLPVIFAAWHDPAARILNVDLLAVLTAAALPWSTTAVAIFMGLWLVALVPTLQRRALLRSLARPPSVLPLAFFALALAGTLWADGPWPARLHGISPAV